MTTKIFTLALMLSTACWAGGSVIGNGAGIVENSFQYAYLTLSTTIVECLEQQRCEMSPAELKTLAEMKQVLEFNKSNDNRIQFVSEKDHPDFFNTGEGQVHRVAKTGLTPQDPIYINLDLLYTEAGRPALDFSTIISILAHEVGHQSGEESHAKLDIIGSKLKKVTLDKIRTHDVEVGPNKELVEVTIINQSLPYRTSDINFSWQNAGSSSVTTSLMQRIHCKSPTSTLASVQIDNGHFTQISVSPTLQVGFAAWVHITCFSAGTSLFNAETKNLSAVITKDLNFRIMSVEDL